MTPSPTFKTFILIMIFYIFLAHLFFPMVFYYIMGKTLSSAGHGFVFGSIVSILLWYGFGSKMIK